MTKKTVVYEANIVDISDPMVGWDVTQSLDSRHHASLAITAVSAMAPVVR
jgi:hypothetical protein